MTTPAAIPDRVVRWENWQGAILPEPASDPPFSYMGNSDSYPYNVKDLLTMNGVEQASAHALCDMFSRAAPRKPPTKKWFATQLELYGIPFRKSDRVEALRETLHTALRAGKCEELAPRFAAVRDRLRNDYDAAFTRLGAKMFDEITGGPHEEARADPPRFVAKYFLDADGKPDRNKTKDVLAFQCGSSELPEVVRAVPGLAILSTWSTVLVGWETEMQRGIEAEFTRLESFFQDTPRIHSAQANVDLGLFLKRYLGIGADGAAPPPDARPSTAIQLTEWDLQNRNLPAEIVAKTPGLFMEKFEDTTVVSWDAVSVAAGIASLKEARRLAVEKEEAEARAEREKEKAETKARWDRRSKGHTELKKRVGPQGPLTLQRLVGSYLVLWDNTGKDSEGSQYNDPCHDDEIMRLDVFYSLGSGKAYGIKASFNFGRIEGTMLLGMTRRDTELLRDMQRDHSWHSDSEDSDVDIHGRGDRKVLQSAVKAEPTRPKDEPTRVKTEPTGAKRPLGEIADPWGVQAARAKRQMLAGGSKAPNPVKAEPQDSRPPIRIKQEPGSGSSSSNTNNSTRVYFQHACSDVGGYPNVDDRNEHIGYFDFDATGLAAKGVIDCSCWGWKAEPLSLFKISEAPDRGKKPMPWCKYDGRRWGSYWSRW